MSHNLFFQTTKKIINQFDEKCKNISFNFITAVVATHFGSWIWAAKPLLSQSIPLGYISGIIGFYLSNLCYLCFKFMIDIFIINFNEQAQIKMALLLQISARMMSVMIGFLFSDALLSIPEMNTGVVFLTGLLTALLFLSLGSAIGLIDLTEKEIIEPGTPMLDVS